MFENYAIFKTPRQITLSKVYTYQSTSLLRTVQKEFWSVYLKVLEGNIIQQDSNRVDKKALKMFPQRHTRNFNLPENILVLKP